ncbi:hypothetical protein C2G38_2036499 [Gigaspora rosea]|uniref:Uncharacterized protein n=1 Tax=Gigaspora rosea TaxID=44941 RepID=A0A397VHZ7_9GLOM|nr:hypothetical protein C2G38_2036499 [Gigaspora rosea]CAG8474651.1 5003_t:CDS:1 [Gigaspora rosea]
MKRVQTNKKIQKVVLRKRITSNISGHIQREECSQTTVSQASLGPINGEDDSSSCASFQKNFSNRSQHINNYHSEDDSNGSDSLQYDRSHHINDVLEYNFFTASDTSSSDDQSTITEEELQMREKEFEQIIVDSGMDF